MQTSLPKGYCSDRWRRGAIGRDNQIVIDMSLYALSVVSLGAVAFVILNSFLMSLGEHRRQFAILRTPGNHPWPAHPASFA